MNEVYIDMRKESKWISKYFNKDLVSIEELLGVIEDLDSELESLQEKYDDLKQDMEDNYRPIPIEEQIGTFKGEY